MVSVGVSGHRDLPDKQSISNAIDEVLRTIMKAYGDGPLQVISPLAEGADRVVVWRAMANYSVHLIAPLPLEISDYMVDFRSFSSKTEFTTLLEQADKIIELPAENTRDACYLAAGEYVLDHSDVLVVVWDGKPASGMGGTAEIVAEARRREMPLAWVQVPDRGKESSPKKRNLARRLPIQYEHFPNQDENEAGS
jgi:hypothetical protein